MNLYEMADIHKNNEESPMADGKKDLDDSKSNTGNILEKPRIHFLQYYNIWVDGK